MRIPSWTPITKDDFPDLDDDVVRAFAVVSDHLAKLTEAMKSRLSVDDNLNTETIDLYMKNDAPQIVTLQKLHGRPLGVLYLATEGHVDLAMHSAEVLDERELRLRVRFDKNVSGTIHTRWLAIGA